MTARGSARLGLAALLAVGPGGAEAPCRGVTTGVAGVFCDLAPPKIEVPLTRVGFTEARFPFLDDEDPTSSVSVGGTSDGRIVNARRVVEGERLAILPEQRARDLGYGSAELVALLDEVGQRTQIRHGSPLWIGNVGRRGGGDIPWSVSHNAGRDADVAFAYLDATGSPVDPPGLVPLDREGRSRDGRYRLDVARTWTIVEGLVTSRAASVQFVFVAEPLKQKLLRYAKAVARPEVVAEADRVMRQPRGALAHDDHLHVRVRCTARDAGGGCVDQVDPDPSCIPARQDRITRARELLAHGSEDLRRNAALRLALLESTESLPAITRLLADPSPAVRFAAATSVAALGGEREVDALSDRLRAEDEPRVQRRLLGGIARIGGARAGAIVRDFLGPFPAPGDGSEIGDRSTPAAEPLVFDLLAREDAPGGDLRDVALEAACVVDSLEPLDALVALLSVGGPADRRAAARALARVTNVAPRCLADPSDDNAAVDRAGYERLKRALGTRARDGWLVAGFRAAGYDVRAIDGRHAWELVRATRGPEHVSYNAQRVLTRLLALPPSAVKEDPERACLDFFKAVDGARSRLHLDRAPRGLRASCTIRN